MIGPLAGEWVHGACTTPAVCLHKACFQERRCSSHLTVSDCPVAACSVPLRRGRRLDLHPGEQGVWGGEGGKECLPPFWASQFPSASIPCFPRSRGVPLHGSAGLQHLAARAPAPCIAAQWLTQCARTVCWTAGPADCCAGGLRRVWSCDRLRPTVPIRERQGEGTTLIGTLCLGHPVPKAPCAWPGAGSRIAWRLRMHRNAMQSMQLLTRNAQNILHNADMHCAVSVTLCSCTAWTQLRP